MIQWLDDTVRTSTVKRSEGRGAQVHKRKKGEISLMLPKYRIAPLARVNRTMFTSVGEISVSVPPFDLQNVM
jgi:hypothetical protein